MMHGIDDGRAWAVAISGAVLKFFVLGFEFISGIFYAKTSQRYNVGRKEASIPFAIASALSVAIGPLVAALGYKFGCRRIVLAGSIMSAVSVGSCFFAENILQLSLLYGVFFGIGKSLSLNLIEYIALKHFTAYRTRAIGLINGGPALAMLVLTPLVDILITEYGLSGTFLILSGCMLNTIPASIIILLNKHKPKPSSNLNSNLAVLDDQQIGSKNKDPPVNVFQTNCRNITCTTEEKGKPQFQNTKSLKSEPHQFKNTPSTKSKVQRNNANPLSTFEKIEACVAAKTENSQFEMNIVETSNLEKQPNAFTSNKVWFVQLVQLLRNPAFVMIAIIVAQYSFVVSTVFIIIVDFAVDIGIEPSKASYILMWMPAWDFLGLQLLGWLIDAKFFSLTTAGMICFSCLGISVASLTLVKSFFMLLFVTSILVIFTDVCILFTPFIAELISDELQVMAVSTKTILSIFTVTLPALIGYFRDGYGNYNGVLIVVGLSCFISVVLCLCLGKLTKETSSSKICETTNL